MKLLQSRRENSYVNIKIIYFPFITQRTIYMEWLLVVVVVFLIFTFFKGGC